jgi:hypothetical protein
MASWLLGSKIQVPEYPNHCWEEKKKNNFYNPGGQTVYSTPLGLKITWPILVVDEKKCHILCKHARISRCYWILLWYDVPISGTLTQTWLTTFYLFVHFVFLVVLWLSSAESALLWLITLMQSFQGMVYMFNAGI